MRHVIWDWNGTLFADLDVVVASVNASLRSLGAEEIDGDGYARAYRRPVRLFYEHLLRREVADAEWAAIDVRFHEEYERLLHAAGLAPGAEAAVARLRHEGFTQSILSMWRHERLLELSGELGIRSQMVLVEGARQSGGHSKVALLADHLRRLRSSGVGADDVVVIGDIDDDAQAAAQSGVQCVLVDSGSQPRHTLQATGAHVAEDVVAAAALVSRLRAGRGTPPADRRTRQTTP